MIKIFKGEATDLEKRAIELALAARDQENYQVNDYGKPLLRTPFEVNDR